MIIPPGVFLIFMKFSFFGLLAGIKGLKIAQSEKKKQQLHRTRAISQEQYNICSLFLVHLCKMISPGYLSVELHVSETIYDMILINGTHV